MGEPTEIRVNPEMIQGDFVSEIELYLPTYIGVTPRWGWHTKHSVRGAPYCMDIWVKIDGAKKSLKFKS